MKKIPALLLIAVSLGVGGQALAQPKPNAFDGGNRWLITAFDDSSPTHQQWATQGLCFLPYAAVGTHIRGLWYSDTFPNWRGRYSQEGDRLLMHGDYASDVGHDGMMIELGHGSSPADEGSGQWTEWREYGSNGLTIVFANTRLRRVGRCPLPPHITDLTTLPLPEIEKLTLELSKQVQPRFLRTGAAAESPTDPDQMPLKEEGSQR